MFEICGYLGACILTFSSLPQLFKTLKTKNVEGISLGMMIAWSLGCFFMLLYVTFASFSWPLFINYLFTFIISSVILALCVKYKKS